MFSLLKIDLRSNTNDQLLLHLYLRKYVLFFYFFLLFITFTDKHDLWWKLESPLKIPILLMLSSSAAQWWKFKNLDSML